MPRLCPHSRPQSGFSLVLVSVMLMVASLILVAFLPGRDAGDTNQKELNSVLKLEKIEEATRSFMAAYGRRPCPADGSSPLGSAAFGKETDTLGDGKCTNSPMGPDAATGNIVAGTIPTRSLSLPDDYAFDEWGRRFTYVVDKRATNNSSCLALEGITSTNHTPNGTGGLQVQIKNAAGTLVSTESTMYAYISHGPDGFGAFPAQGSSVANRINSGSTEADQRVNAGVDASFNVTAASFTNKRVQKDYTPVFDDIAWYRPDIKNICCLGPLCTPVTQPGFRVDGYAAGEWSGSSVAVGDVNGDGIPDLVIGAYYDSPNGVLNAGAVYVVFGTKKGFPDPLPLNTLDGTNGFALAGPSNSLGWATMTGENVVVSNIRGAVSSSGHPISDIIIGTAINKVFVVFGGETGAKNSTGTAWTACTSTGAPGSMPCILTTSGGSPFINGTNGMEFDGGTSNSAWFGADNATGDLNGDGFADIIIGATGDAPGGATNAGSVFVVFGGASGANNAAGISWSSCHPCTLDSTFINGTNGVEFDGSGNNNGVGAGSAVAAGNINGAMSGVHSIDDLIIGAGAASHAGTSDDDGAAYVVFGHNPSLLPTATVTTYNNSSCVKASSISGTLLAGETIYAAHIPTGTAINSIGTACNDGGGSCSGASCITLSAHATQSVPSEAMAVTAVTVQSGAGNFLDGVRGFEFDGQVFGGYAGSAVTAGDINGDGYADIIVGGSTSSGGVPEGATYVIFGGVNGPNGTSTLWTSCPCALQSGGSNFLNDTNGVEIDYPIGPSTDFGANNFAVGDVNGDTIPDLIIGMGSSNNYTGSAYLLFGHGGSWSSMMLNSGNSLQFQGNAYAPTTGVSVAAGDINGDNIADVIIGADGESPKGNSKAGSTYVFFGKKTSWPASPYSLNSLCTGPNC